MSRFLVEVLPEHQSGRGRYWRPESSGYTDEVAAAGLYTEDEARRIVERSDRSIMVPALPLLHAAWVKADEVARRLWQTMELAHSDVRPCGVEAPHADEIGEQETAEILGSLAEPFQLAPPEADGTPSVEGRIVLRLAAAADRKTRADLTFGVAHGWPAGTLKSWLALNIESALRSHRQVVRRADEEREAARLAESCPGDGQCHGTMKWCDICGDVSDTCHDSTCHEHGL